jgi:peptidoglycan-N-acetylglucosamine deacetylase
MDADPEGYFNSSMLFKASILTITFTSFYFYKSGKQLTFLRKPFVKNDSVIIAKPENKPAAKKKKKTIYLTFDDGPCKGSKTVRSIMQQEQVPSTFFIIGEHVYGSSKQLAIYDSLKACSLIELANHSYSHAFENKFSSFYNQPDSATKDFVRCADSLDFTSNIIRTPGRNIWRTKTISSTDLKASSVAADSFYNKGFKAVGWDIEWHFDDTQKLVQTDTEMLNMVDSAFARNETKTTNHLVLLSHDRTFQHTDDSAKLHRFVIALKKREEYDFEIISKYPDL